jgi:hypothetical protein
MALGANSDGLTQLGSIEVVQQRAQRGLRSPGRIEQHIAGGDQFDQATPVLAPELFVALFKGMVCCPHFFREELIVERHDMIEDGLMAFYQQTRQQRIPFG